MSTPKPYSTIPNTFKSSINKGEVQIGCWSSLTSPITAEILGLAGFDWIVLDAEHAPNELSSLIVQLMALKDSSSAPVVRPEWNDPVLLKRLLDAGFYNFLIPFIDTVEDAKMAVRATRYPPEGIRGISVSMRGNRYGTQADFFEKVNQNIAIIVQIESREAVDNVSDIVAVEGIDAVFIGPSDLAAGLGHLGDPSHPEVQEAIRQIVAAAKNASKAVGILATVESDARRYLEMGMTLVAVGSDQGLLRKATQELRNKF
jgi:2-dehydro-3-deoxyglucarate aldolase